MSQEMRDYDLVTWHMTVISEITYPMSNIRAYGVHAAMMLSNHPFLTIIQALFECKTLSSLEKGTFCP